MGPALCQRQATLVSSVPVHALPSPSSVHETPLDTPSPAHAPAHLFPSQQSQPASPGLLRRSCRFDDSAAAIIRPEPEHLLPTCPVATPATEAPVFADMNLIVSGALAPVHVNRPPVREPSRPRPAFRLPSFDALGIAAPHPDRFGSLVLGGDDLNAMPAPDLVNDTDAESLLPAFGAVQLSPECPSRSKGRSLAPNGGRAVSTPFRHDVATLTPPAEVGEIQWRPIVALSSTPMESPAIDAGSSRTAEPHATGGADSSAAHPPAGPTQLSTGPAARTWLDQALKILLRNLNSAAFPANPLRVLSHALPSPSSNGHIFPQIIEAMHRSTPTQPTVWINVFHAIQGRFNLADLPTSPPATPGPPIGGDDYFTQKVFDSAVPISDYQEDLSGLPRSPRPVVPPSSINVSIVERYIPPTSSHEFADMFNPSGPSLLVDRLVELSPHNGSLIFIYPTRTGAQTFMKDYLGPILDPALRSIVVVNGLSSNLSILLGRMMAVGQMLEFEQMRRSVDTLCAKLTQRSSSMQRFHGHRATFTLAHASAEQVHLDRETWAKDWWSKQEKPRIRDAMTRYTQDAQKKSSNENVDRSPTPTELIQQLLDFVSKRDYPPGQKPTRGVEVSVFVIQRSN